MDAHPAVSARLLLADRPLSLIDEGIDVGLRIAEPADSSIVATRVGEVRQLVVAAPRYLSLHPCIEKPADLAKHQIITVTHFGHNSWTFPPLRGSSVPRTVQFAPRLVTNSVHGMISSVLEGRGVARLMSYQIAEHVRDGELEILLPNDELPPLPVHLISPPGRLSVPKVRAFVDFAVPRLRGHFARLAKDLHNRGTVNASPCERVLAE
jgi:DNA-binding transcriptional LysR family regulator